MTQPNSVVNGITVDPKGKGQECFDQVCRMLGIIEQDYFGLVYKGRGGESLWLNMRNRLDRQLCGPAPYRLQLKVKFFVPPQNLVQQTTRSLFYEQVKMDFDSQKLRPETEEQRLRMIALIAQAEQGNFDKRCHQLNLYKTKLCGVSDPTPEDLHSIVAAHTQLCGTSREVAQYRLLQEAAELENYGVEFHEASVTGEIIQVGVGPKGVALHKNNSDVVERLEYPAITRAEHQSKTCALKVMNDNGTERDLVLRLSSHLAANAVYRCITEMHSFFCCDTVHNEVSSQFSRDLKGTLASLFNEKTTLGRDYVFDIKRTAREAHDHARRMLFRQASLTETTKELMISETERTDCDTQMLSAEEKCQVLEETLEKIEDSCTCVVCRDEKISAALCPCGHLTCWNCANKLVECPLCRHHIDKVQKIFLPVIQDKGGACASISSISLKPVVNSTSQKHSNKRRRTAYTENEELEAEL